MGNRLTFYFFIAALTVLDAVLIRSPNLVGKIGLLIYKYHYLRTFPKALLTVALVVGISAILAETVRFVVRKELVKRLSGKVILFLLIILASAVGAKVGMDFSSGSYSHTGIRFRSGAYLLPAILLIVFVYSLITLPRIQLSFPESPAVKDNGTTDDN